LRRLLGIQRQQCTCSNGYRGASVQTLLMRNRRSKPMKQFVTALLLLACQMTHHVVSAATPEAIRDIAEAFLQEQTRSLPGQVRVSVAPLRDQQLFLAACDAPEAFLPQGQQLWGRVTIGVRCKSDKRSLPVHLNGMVQVSGRYLVLSRPLTGGQQIAESDLQWQEGELTRHPADLITRPEQAIGRSTRQALSRAQPLRATYLQSGVQIRAGQDVMIVARGAGFSVQNNGRALNAAALGELVRVKLGNGRIISGVLREDGTVVVDD
jgi:flagellar basal body P-ring formation protein FlgA